MSNSNHSYDPGFPRDWARDVVRYPEPAVEVIDPRFAKYKIGNAALERLCTGHEVGRRAGLVW